MNYSELIGSFIRKSDQPLEANFIFLTLEDLKNFYATNKEEKGNIHKGLFKIVENDGKNNQVLYWVQSDDKNELEFTPLISGSDIVNINEAIEELRGAIDFIDFPEGLEDLLKLAKSVEKVIADAAQIKKELQATVGTDKEDILEYITTLPVPYNSVTKISETLNKFFRDVDKSNNNVNTWVELVNFLDGYKDTDKLKTIIDKIYSKISETYNDVLGTPIPSEEFRTLRKVEDFTRENLQELQFKIKNLQTEMNNTQIGVGLDSDGKFSADHATKYLKTASSVMNALRILDLLIDDAINNTNIEGGKTKSVDIKVIKGKDKSTVFANVLLDQEGDLIERDGGIYSKIRISVENGTLKQYVNDKLVTSTSLGLSGMLEKVYYDSATESIVMSFKLTNGEISEVRFPLHELIEEWDVNNEYPSKVVSLEKIRNISGKDELSADVRISKVENNILEKKGNALFVPRPFYTEIEHQTTLEKIALLTLAVEKVKDDLLDIKHDISANFKDIDKSISEINEKIKIISDTLSKNVAQTETNKSDISKLREDLDSIMYWYVATSIK